MIRRITVLVAVLALVVPAAASAAQSDVSAALAQERYYMGSDGETAATPAPAPSAITRALAEERYYMGSDGETAATPAAAPAGSATPKPAPAVADDDMPWKALAIGSGALVLALLGAELVTVARLRRAT
jgi:hypothetical protein